jgi:hypothetical protein
MNAFHDRLKMETDALELLTPALCAASHDGRFVVARRGTLSNLLQPISIDVICQDSNQKAFGIEVKAEAKFTGNLYLETWSNLDFDRRKPGWMFSCRADCLWTLFFDTLTLHKVNFRNLWEWSFSKGRIYDFPELPQRKAEQLNKTFGRCVPIRVLEQECGLETVQLLREAA